MVRTNGSKIKANTRIGRHSDKQRKVNSNCPARKEHISDEGSDDIDDIVDK